jgi:hypothetical protein
MVSSSPFCLKEGEFPEGWPSDALNVTSDENRKVDESTRPFLITNESENQKLYGMILLSSNIVPKKEFLEKSKKDLLTICMFIKRSDTGNETFLRMDNLMSKPKDKNYYPKDSGHVKISCEEFCFKLSYVIGNVENNFKPSKEDIHYGKVFQIVKKKNQYLVVLSPNLICIDTREAFNWVFCAKFLKEKSKITLIEVRRFKKISLLDVNECKPTSTKIDKKQITEIRKEIFEIFVGAYANARLKFKKCLHFIEIFKIMENKNVTSLQSMCKEKTWSSFVELFEKWEIEKKVELVVWNEFVDLYGEFSHLKRIFKGETSEEELSHPEKELDENQMKWEFLTDSFKKLDFEQELNSIPTENGWDNFSNSFKEFKKKYKEEINFLKTVG